MTEPVAPKASMIDLLTRAASALENAPPPVDTGLVQELLDAAVWQEYQNGIWREGDV